jgi:tetratricopeptide (TPR) repeat protein
VQAAEALEHAHHQGVIHRDIKPANLLVDGRGHLWITDFGLAHCQSQAGLTMSGDLVGTLRYMSPEQALAKRVLIDHRTDIYSLGVTLYELLTLEPAFSGRDREELLGQIAFEEPRPLRRLNKPIPAELETIVLKAMEKHPAERYATAQELADDLRRLLEDKPIRAKQPTLLQRALKWSRRHKATMRAGAVVLILAFVGLATSTWLIWLEKEQTKREQERTQAALAAAQANAQIAQQNLETAYKILDQIYVETAEKRLPREKELTAQDRQFLEKTLTFYEQFGSQQSSDPRIRQKTAQANLRVGAIQERLGQEAQAETAYRHALAISTQLVEEFPNQVDNRQILARCYSSLGGWLGNLMGFRPCQELEQAYAEAVRLQKQLVQEFPANLQYQHDLGWTYFRLGYSRLGLFWNHGGGSAAQAEEDIREAVAIRERLVAENSSDYRYRQELGMSLGNLGNILTLRGSLTEAEQVLRRNLELREKPVQDFPTEPEARHYLADAYQDLAVLHNRTHQLQEVEKAYRQELSIRRKLAAEFPSDRVYEGRLTNCNRNLQKTLVREGRLDQAEAECRDSPEAYLHLGSVLADQKKWPAALAEIRKALDLKPDSAHAPNAYAWLLAICPESEFWNPAQAVGSAKKATELAPKEGPYWNTLGIAYYRAGDWQAAIRALEKSMTLQHGDNVGAWLVLGMAHWQLGHKDEAHRWYHQALSWMDKNKPRDETLNCLRAEAAKVLGIHEQALNK